jgi:hypothetical protein
VNQLSVQELVIVIAAKNNNPTILTADFLKYSGIIPSDWELARQPVLTNSAAQVIFTNGVSIVAEPNRVIFIEAIADKEASAIAIPQIARKYVETLPNAEYQAMGLNPRGYARFDADKDAAHNYLSQTLLTPGAWSDVGTSPAKATINYVYTLERGQFNLSVNEAGLRQSDDTTTPIVLFSGNFSYDIANEDKAERLKNLYQAIDTWQADLDTYRDIVDSKFLVNQEAKPTPAKPATPDVFVMATSAA